MSESISKNCQAILLLTAPLIFGKATPPVELLRASEYRKLASYIRGLSLEPADLLNPDSDALRSCSSLFERGRIDRLMARGFQLAQALEYWNARSIWVASRADTGYFKRIKARLREEAPPILYGCGDRAYIDNGGLAVVGSRAASDEVLDYARAAGELAALGGRALISGGAKGVDSAAMDGAASHGGFVCNVMAENLAQASVARKIRDSLVSKRLMLISPYDPSSGFNVGHALARNKIIFALADIGLVVNSDIDKGGTWAGATEQLRKLHFVPLYVRSLGQRSQGLDALAAEGALPWPNPPDGDALDALFKQADPRVAAGDGLADLVPPPQDVTPEAQTTVTVATVNDDPFSNAHAVVSPQVAAVTDTTESELNSGPSVTPALDDAQTRTAQVEQKGGLHNALLDAFKQLLPVVLTEPMKLNRIADELDLNSTQDRIWLDRLIADGLLQKHKRGTYSLCEAPARKAEPQLF